MPRYLRLLLTIPKSRGFYLRAISLTLVVCLLGQDFAWAAESSLGSWVVGLGKEKQNQLQWAKKILPDIPESIATIEDAWQQIHGFLKTQDPRPKTDFVILIQDAHTNISSQVNQAKLLDMLLKDNGKWNVIPNLPQASEGSNTSQDSSAPASGSVRNDSFLIFTEGGSGSLNLAEYRKSLPLADRQRIAKKYLQRGLLHATEYLDLTSDKDFTLYGVEDESLYEKSLKIYNDIALERKVFSEYLEKINNTIQTLKPKVLNPFLLAFDRKLSKPDLGEREKIEAALNQCQILGLPIPENFKRLQKIQQEEKSIDFKLADKEQTAFLITLSKEDADELKKASLSKDEKVRDGYFLVLSDKIKDSSIYPNLRRYLEYFKAWKALDTAALMQEFESLTNLVYDALAKTDEEKALLAASDLLSDYKKLFSISMTPKEYEEYKEKRGRWESVSFPRSLGGNQESTDPRQKHSGMTAHYSSITWLTGFLNQKLLELNTDHDKALFLELGFEEALSKAERFYELTYERDEAFIKNMQESVLSLGSWVLGEQKSTDLGRLPTTHDPRPTTILITGGFHTENLKRLLKDKNISFISITPRTLEETNTQRYEEILLSQLKNTSTPQHPLKPSLTPALLNTGFLKGQGFMQTPGAGEIVKELSGSVRNDSGAVTLAGARFAISIQDLAAQAEKDKNNIFVDISLFPDGPVKRFIEHLNTKQIDDLLLGGGAVRDTLLGQNPGDLDFMVKIKLTPEEQKRFDADLLRLSPEELLKRYSLFGRAMKVLEEIASKLEISIDELRHKTGKFETTPLEYMFATYVVGQTIINVSKGDTFTIDGLAIDRHGKIYFSPDGGALQDLRDKRLRFEVRGRQKWEDIFISLKYGMRAYRFKYQYGFSIDEEDEVIIKKRMKTILRNSSRHKQPTNPQAQAASIAAQLNSHPGSFLHPQGKQTLAWVYEMWFQKILSSVPPSNLSRLITDLAMAGVLGVLDVQGVDINYNLNNYLLDLPAEVLKLFTPTPSEPNSMIDGKPTKIIKTRAQKIESEVNGWVLQSSLAGMDDAKNILSAFFEYAVKDESNDIGKSRSMLQSMARDNKAAETILTASYQTMQRLAADQDEQVRGSVYRGALYVYRDEAEKVLKLKNEMPVEYAERKVDAVLKMRDIIYKIEIASVLTTLVTLDLQAQRSLSTAGARLASQTVPKTGEVSLSFMMEDLLKRSEHLDPKSNERFTQEHKLAIEFVHSRGLSRMTAEEYAKNPIGKMKTMTALERRYKEALALIPTTPMNGRHLSWEEQERVLAYLKDYFQHQNVPSNHKVRALFKKYGWIEGEDIRKAPMKKRFPRGARLSGWIDRVGVLVVEDDMAELAQLTREIKDSLRSDEKSFFEKAWGRDFSSSRFIGSDVSSGDRAWIYSFLALSAGVLSSESPDLEDLRRLDQIITQWNRKDHPQKWNFSLTFFMQLVTNSAATGEELKAMMRLSGRGTMLPGEYRYKMAAFTLLLLGMHVKSSNLSSAAFDEINVDFNPKKSLSLAIEVLESGVFASDVPAELREELLLGLKVGLTQYIYGSAHAWVSNLPELRPLQDFIVARRDVLLKTMQVVLDKSRESKFSFWARSVPWMFQYAFIPHDLEGSPTSAWDQILLNGFHPDNRAPYLQFMAKEGRAETVVQWYTYSDQHEVLLTRVINAVKNFKLSETDQKSTILHPWGVKSGDGAGARLAKSEPIFEDIEDALAAWKSRFNLPHHRVAAAKYLMREWLPKLRDDSRVRTSYRAAFELTFESIARRFEHDNIDRAAFEALKKALPYLEESTGLDFFLLGILHVIVDTEGRYSFHLREDAIDFFIKYVKENDLNRSSRIFLIRNFDLNKDSQEEMVEAVRKVEADMQIAYDLAQHFIIKDIRGGMESLKLLQNGTSSAANHPALRYLYTHDQPHEHIFGHHLFDDYQHTRTILQTALHFSEHRDDPSRTDYRFLEDTQGARLSTSEIIAAINVQVDSLTKHVSKTHPSRGLLNEIMQKINVISIYSRETDLEGREMFSTLVKKLYDKSSEIENIPYAEAREIVRLLKILYSEVPWSHDEKQWLGELSEKINQMLEEGKEQGRLTKNQSVIFRIDSSGFYEQMDKLRQEDPDTANNNQDMFVEHGFIPSRQGGFGLEEDGNYTEYYVGKAVFENIHQFLMKIAIDIDVMEHHLNGDSIVNSSEWGTLMSWVEQRDAGARLTENVIPRSEATRDLSGATTQIPRFARNGKALSILRDVLLKEKSPQRVLSFIVRVTQEQGAKVGEIAIGSQKYVTRFSGKTLVISGVRYRGEIRLNPKRYRDHLSKEVQRAQSAELDLSVNDFKLLYDQSNHVVDTAQFTHIHESREALVEIDLDAIAVDRQWFSAIGLPLLIQEMQRASRKPWGATGKYLFTGSEELKLMVADKISKVGDTEKNLERAVFYDTKNIDAELLKRKAVMTTHETSVIEKGVRYIFMQTPKEGDIPNYRAELRGALAWSRVEGELALSNPGVLELIEYFRKVGVSMKGAYGSRELFWIITGQTPNPDIIKIVAFPPIVRYSAAKAIQAARLAVAMTSQSA